MDDCRRKVSTNKFSFSSQEIRNIISGILNLEFSDGGKKEEKVPDHTKVNQALFSTSSRTEDERTNGTNTYKATQGLSLLVSDSSDTIKATAIPINTSKNLIHSASQQPDQIVDEIIQLYSQDNIDRERTASTFRNIPTATTQQGKKRHIMISYNRSSRRMENKYIVWMDKVNMGDDILVSMANAVENLYIVLLCINQHYYESHYCRLEVEYAAEKRIKFIACLMEKSFRAGSWLGIIKGSSLHVDFSSNAEFNGSSNELIRLITNIEKQLCLNPRRTPTPCRSPDALRFIAISPSHAGSSTCAHRQFANRVESIIEQYKRTIGKEHHPMKHLKTHELLQLIEILRQPAPKKKSISSYCSYQSEGDSKMINADRQSLEKICNRILDQNERLINIVLIMMGIFVLSVFFVQRNNTL
ncbi:unnamed protein product [Rotaria magnacalcarata]|uniref:TIR domain-containing protein n=1 Tax=Rotaria magnacalcarata TaxID=392030 RepID=A0A816QZA3_9BILA|nr:unnamed protein product [Rotaria magnacalcarata]CAF4200106.1 unnamed protein product [Rotaria magnacalcarata]